MAISRQARNFGQLRQIVILDTDGKHFNSVSSRCITRRQYSALESIGSFCKKLINNHNVDRKIGGKGLVVFSFSPNMIFGKFGSPTHFFLAMEPVLSNALYVIVRQSIRHDNHEHVGLRSGVWFDDIVV